MPLTPDMRRSIDQMTTNLDNEHKAELGLPQEGFHIILANPPFAGRVDKDRVVEEVKVGTSTATELLFLKYMMDNLREPTNPRTGAGGGRCGVIVPEGVLFGSTGAHKELRRQLIENNRVEAVLSLPGVVFQPYSGVKTSVLFFQMLPPNGRGNGGLLTRRRCGPTTSTCLPGAIGQ